MTEPAADGWTVEVTYPLRIDPADSTWLQAAANRYSGQLGFLREIHPPRQDVHFKTIADAEAFANDVGSSLSWQARRVRHAP